MTSSAELQWNDVHHAPSFSQLDPPPTVVLITSNLQHDFFTRFPKRKETMNPLWVGRKESERVLGLDMARGPLAQLMTWIRGYAAQMPPESLVPNFQEDESVTSSAHGPNATAVDPESQDHDEEDEQMEDGGPIDLDIDLEQMEDLDANPQARTPRTKMTAGATDTTSTTTTNEKVEWEGRDNNETTSTGVPSTASSPQLSDHPMTPTGSSLMINTPAGISPSSSVNASVRSPNVTISPSPASSTMPSPSPTHYASHAKLTIPSINVSLPSNIPIHHSSSTSSASQLRSADHPLPPPHSSSSHSIASAPFAATAAAFSAGTSSSSAASPRLSQVELEKPSIYVIHVRTCIDKSKPSSAAAIERYREYCLQGSDGVRLCNRMDENMDQYPNECIINTNRMLNSNTYRALKKKLHQIRVFVQKKHIQRLRAAAVAAGHSPNGSTISPSVASALKRPPLKLAVIGGWTDEDVYHLCYELRTRLMASSLATCSQLTASPSQSQHWNTLSQLKRVMNVTVTRTIKELIGWFGVGILPYRLPGIPYMPSRIWPTLEWNVGSTRPHNFHPDIDGELMAHLYRNSSRIVIDTLVGGFSSSIVLSVNSVDHSGVREAPTVVKLASREDTATEYQAFQRIEEMLGNNAPSIRAFVELGDRGAMKFRYTRMSGGKVRTLKDLFEHVTDGDGINMIYTVIDEIYGEIFGGWYAAAHTEMFDLYSYYFDGFLMSHGEPVSMVHQDPRYLKQFISYVLAKPGTDASNHFKKEPDFYGYPPFEGETFIFPGCAPLTNLGILFEKQNGMPYLRTLPPRRLYSTFAHGDANLQNFLLDGRGNIWVIDFFFTEPRNHVLRDIAKTWSCVMYIAAEITTDKQFAQAFLISEELAASRDLHAPLPPTVVGLTDVHLKAIYGILQKLWTHVGRIVKDRSYAVQFQLALVAEAMRHFLYATRNMYSRRWALATAVLLSESVLIQEKRIHDVTPSWLPLESIPLARGSLGMTRSPGNRNYMRFERRVEPLLSNLLTNNENTTSPKSTTSSTTTTKDTSEFRRELTLEERALKEHRERVLVTAKQASAQGEPGSTTRIAWEERLKREYDHLVQQQELERATYEKELLERRTRRQRSTQLEGSKKSLLQEEEEEEDEIDMDGEVDPLAPPVVPDTKRGVSFESSTPLGLAASSEHHLPQLPSPHSMSATPPLPSASHRHTPRSRSIGGRASGTLATFFERTESLEGSEASSSPPAITIPATIVQSISHPELRSQLATVLPATVSPPSQPIPSSIPLSSLASSPVSSASTGLGVPVKRMPRLQKECLRLKEEGVTHLLLLLTDAEFKEMGVDKKKLHQFMSEYRIQVITVSMPPGIMQVPLLMDLVKFSLGILCDERKYKLVLVSKGGFHRAGTVAACILCAFGQPPELSIRTVRECRGAQAIGRDSRERNVIKFDLEWKKLLIAHIVQTGQLTAQKKEEEEALEKASAHHTTNELHSPNASFSHAQSYSFI